MMRISTAFYYQRAVRDMQNSLSEIAQLQAQFGSGKKIIRPSDGPAEAARAIDLKQAISRLDQFERNRNAADQKLGLINATLKSANNVLQRIRDLTIRANSGAQTDETRSIIKTEIKQRLHELLDYANARDGNGEFIFAGSQGKTQPFALTPAGAVYNGDQSALHLQISANRTLKANASGYEIFQRIRTGNGRFTTHSHSANAGSGVITAGSVTDASAHAPGNFRIVFTSANTFNVINGTTGATLLSAQPYTENAAINFNGVQVAIAGKVNAGDRFNVSASRHQDIFTTLKKLLNTLSIRPADNAGKAQLQQGLQNALGDIDQALNNILNIRTSVGTRQNSLASAHAEASNAKLVLQKTLSETEDLDVTGAISRLTLEVNALKALQATFAKLQNLSLFNFL